MDQLTILKYVAGAVLLGSVYWLVMIDKVTSQEYIMLVTGALGALGITAFTKGDNK